MAVRIEYLLLTLLVILLVSVVGINPSSHEAKSSNGQKELEFENFALYNIKTDEATQEMFAVKMTKYKNHLEMNDVDLRDEKGYELLSHQAVYESSNIYMDSGVKILSQDGFEFKTPTLTYNVETKDIQTDASFVMEYNQSTIKGQNLALSMNNKHISADKIEAKIYFIAQ
jgi:LPS export ABC transporter protein LptC